MKEGKRGKKRGFTSLSFVFSQFTLKREKKRKVRKARPSHFPILYPNPEFIFLFDLCNLSAKNLERFLIEFLKK